MSLLLKGHHVASPGLTHWAQALLFLTAKQGGQSSFPYIQCGQDPISLFKSLSSQKELILFLLYYKEYEKGKHQLWVETEVLFMCVYTWIRLSFWWLNHEEGGSPESSILGSEMCPQHTRWAWWPGCPISASPALLQGRLCLARPLSGKD